MNRARLALAVPGESTPSRAGRAPRAARREPEVVAESRRGRAHDPTGRRPLAKRASNAADRGARSAQQGDFPRVLLEPLFGALVMFALVGCTFTGEPDPGGVADVSDAGQPGPPPVGADAEARLDAGAALDMGQAAPPDAQFDDDAQNEPPADGGMGDMAGDAAPDAAPFDGDLPDGDLPDGDLPDGDLPDGDLPDGDLPDGDLPDGDVDAGPPTPEDDCDYACSELVACGPGPDAAECRRECLAEDNDHPGTAERLAGCVTDHIADGRCDIAALQTCTSDEPLPLDPACVLACDGLAQCEELPDRPDCAATCTEEPGPDRQRLHRCVDAHVADGRCDGIGFIVCADDDPSPEDTCRFVCSALLDCDAGVPFDGCVAGCLDDVPESQRAVAVCASSHLDRGRCAVDDFQACADR